MLIPQGVKAFSEVNIVKKSVKENRILEEKLRKGEEINGKMVDEDKKDD